MEENRLSVDFFLRNATADEERTQFLFEGALQSLRHQANQFKVHPVLCTLDEFCLEASSVLTKQKSIRQTTHRNARISGITPAWDLQRFKSMLDDNRVVAHVLDLLDWALVEARQELMRADQLFESLVTMSSLWCFLYENQYPGVVVFEDEMSWHIGTYTIVPSIHRGPSDQIEVRLKIRIEKNTNRLNRDLVRQFCRRIYGMMPIWFFEAPFPLPLLEASVPIAREHLKRTLRLRA